MIDSVIKGTGNSRKLKSISNFAAQYPTYEAFASAMASGTLPIDLGINEAGWAQLGTALNKGNLFSDTTAAKYPAGTDTPDQALGVLGAGVLSRQTGVYTKKQARVGSLSVGSTVWLMENGVMTKYIVVQQGTPSASMYANCDGTWLFRAELTDFELAWGGGRTSNYLTSSVYKTLNSTVLNRFDSAIQNAMKNAKVPYDKSGGGSTANIMSGANGAEGKIFLLTASELGIEYRGDGIKLSYFDSGTGTAAKDKRLPGYYLLRSKANYDDAAIISTTGVTSWTPYDSAIYQRYAFVLDSSTVLTWYEDNAGNGYPEQKYKGQFTDVLGNLVAIPSDQLDYPVQIATGSYTGTGTYGSNNPNTLMFPFAPKYIFITRPDLGATAAGTNLNMVYDSPKANAPSATVDVIWNKNSVSWYSTSADNYQLNLSGQTYYYFAIG